MKNERSAADVYGGMPAGEMHDIVNRCAGLLAGAYAGAAIATATGTGTGTGAGAAMSIGEGTGTATATGAGTGTSAAMPTGTGTGTGTGTAQNIPSLHLQEPSVRRERPLNVVLIVEESLGAQYTGVLGGAGLTPEFDRLAGLGWNFTQAYATGTRSVRGLEAVVAGFPPTVSDAALRLPDAQSNFFTLAQALRRQGYRSRFIYGGEAHFDNMKSFFFGNGFDDLYDRATFENPAFVGTWGASDEDMFAQLDRLLSNPPNQPTLTLAFSVTNHSPWEYPQGRIEPLGEPASVENTVRYADWALGRFFDKAMRSDYWKDTVFLVVADHDSRVFGASLVPLRHFHIPALILGADVPARSDERLISQIDLPPTLLSLAGIRAEHPMIGHDLCRAEAGGRALMQYSDNYGYLRDDRLLVLEPHRPPSQYRYTAPETYEPAQLDPELAREAQAHVLWPAWMYKNRRYTLPPSRSTA
ncbi:sulfatase [Candidimonas nitroreducens]|uniref:Sulfatase n=2 Tax=Candidimonas nitroreducens TaxID=683354 RepID=A0A225MGJ6_9BURK|nr:sulfatase [Candidimonas nitroreducens]